jgi:hypothetical protein
MISSHILSIYLWIAPHALLLGVVIVLLRNGRYREFPFFFSYVVFEVFQFCLLFVMSRLDSVSLSTYIQTDLFCRTGSLALHFGIIKELFEAPLAHSPGLRKSAAFPLNLASVLFVVLASAFTALLYMGERTAAFVQPYVIEQVVDTAQCGLLVVVFIWHRYLGIWMKNASFGIAVGLGLVTGLNPLLSALRNYIDVNSGFTNIASAIAFHVSVLIWLYFSLLQEKAAPLPNAHPAIDLHGWNAELARFSQL